MNSTFMCRDTVYLTTECAIYLNAAEHGFYVTTSFYSEGELGASIGLEHWRLLWNHFRPIFICLSFFFFFFQLARYVVTDPLVNTTGYTHATVAAASTKGRAVAPSLGIARAMETVQWTRATVMTVRHAG